MQFKKDVRYDISRLYELANDHEKQILQNMDLIILENKYLRDKLADLETQLESLDAAYRSYITDYQSTKKITKTLLDPDATISSLMVSDGVVSGTANIVDNTYGIATVPSKKVSKLCGKSVSGEYYLPADLNMYLYEGTSPLINSGAVLTTETVNSLTVVRDEELYKAFTVNKDEYWLRESYQEDSVQEVYGAIRVKVPFSIINSLFANSIILNPCPEYSMILLDIQYKDTNDNWFRLPTYPVTSGSPQEITEFKKTKFLFEQIEATELFVYFKQTNKIAQATRNVFSYGMYKVDLVYEEFTNNSAKFITKFGLNGSSFESITIPKLAEAVGTIPNINAFCTHQLYYGDTVEPRNFNETIIEPDIDEVYIETTLNLINGVSPSPTSIEIEYTTQS